jgi:hypothetical protein
METVRVHTLIVVFIGLGLLLGACAFAGQLSSGGAAIATAVLVFIPLWLVGAAINMDVGAKKAGYSVMDETPVFLVVFAIPAAAAIVAWWRLR